MGRNLSRLFTAVLVLAYLAASAVAVLFLNSDLRRQALRHSEEKAQLLLDRNLATHTYFSHTLKPKVFQLLEKAQEDRAYFEPAWMSSTFAVRHIEGHFRQLSGLGYIYKECASNARSPENEADDYERSFIEALNLDPALQRKTSIRVIDGAPYLTVLRRGETLEETCLRCHSTPDAAPGGLVEAYGDARSFGRHTGEVISAISIRIPLAEAYRAANATSLRLSAALLAILGALLVVHSLLNRKLVFSPLARLREQARLIGSSPGRLGEQIPRPWGEELREVADALNAMSRSLGEHHSRLEETVAHRTAELNRAVEALEEDIAKRRAAETTLEKVRHQTKQILDTAADGIFGLDRQGDTIFVNPAAERLLGWRAEELEGASHHDRIHHTRPDGTPYPWQECPIRQAMDQGEVRHVSGEYFWGRDGKAIPVEYLCSPIREGEIVTGAVVTFRDITERRRTEERIRHLAFFDQLTGLPNRQLFQDRLSQALAKAQRSGEQLAVLFLDLDGFKRVNDRFGHAGGDQYLQLTAGRLLDSCRQSDSLARFAGDEFVFFGTVKGKEDSSRIARKMLSTLAEPVMLEAGEASCGGSIGIATYPRDGAEIETLLTAADQAMYRAKAAGKNTFRFASEGNDE